MSPFWYNTDNTLNIQAVNPSGLSKAVEAC